MKKLLFFLTLCLTWNALFAQQTRFFIQSEMTAGSLLNDSRFESNEYFGYSSARTRSEVSGLDEQGTNWSYGVGIRSGIRVNDFIYLHTGIRYRKVIDKTVSYFDALVCGVFFDPVVVVPAATQLQTDFLEIPLGFRFNILKNKRLQPYISSEVFWAKAMNKKDLDIIKISYAKDLDLFRIAYKAGAAYKIGKLRNWEISLQSGLNTNLGKQKSYPRYHFREVTAEVGVLRAF